MATIHTGRDGIATDPWFAKALAELHDLGFTTGTNEDGWYAVRDAGPYRTRIVPASRGWRVLNVRARTGEVTYEPRATLDKAIECAITAALSIDALVGLTNLLTVEVEAELRRAL